MADFVKRRDSWKQYPYVGETKLREVELFFYTCSGKEPKYPQGMDGTYTLHTVIHNLAWLAIRL